MMSINSLSHSLFILAVACLIIYNGCPGEVEGEDCTEEYKSKKHMDIIQKALSPLHTG